jgi:hypothetical protein
MKYIKSLSKMREKMPLDPKKKSGEFATFEKGKETELSNADFDYLNDSNNSMLPFLIKEGTFIVVDKPEEKPVSKKQQKKEKKMAKEVEAKKAAEDKEQRQGK